jgi:peptidyl-prolyl cis-trans isomerase SurA
MEPAMRDYLTTMREEAYIDIRPGYSDTGASPKQTKPVYSAYTPPVGKKKKKVERTRFRESTRTFRQKSPQAAATADTASPATKKNASLDTTSKKSAKAAAKAQKSGKKEKIRFGKAPTKTLPSAPETKVEDAGATQQTAGATQQSASAADEPVNPLVAEAKPTQKTRFSARAKVPKQPKAAFPPPDKMAPAPADAAEVADRQTQAGPLGLAGDTSKKKKKSVTTTGEKTRLADKNKTPQAKPQGPEMTPTPVVPGAPAPAPQPAPAAQLPPAAPSQQ